MIGLLALAAVLLGVATEITITRVLYARLDGQLTAAASRLPGQGRPIPPDEQCPRPRGGFPPGQVIGTLAARVCGGTVISAEVLVEQDQPRPDVGPELAVLERVPQDGKPRTYDLGSLGDYRVVAVPLTRGSVQVTGLPLADTQRALYLVAGVVAGVTLLVLVAGGLLGAVIVRRSLRPLDRVAATAARVSGSRLDRGEVVLTERVADADPSTEVGKVGAAFNRMLDHVGSALAARQASETRVRQFVADASHELRTPLAAIRGYAELSRRAEGQDVRYMLGRVESEAERMTGLVEDLLLLARLDSGRPLEREPVDLTALAVDVLHDAHAMGPDHVWRLEVPSTPVSVVGDPARLHQVLANLLANARRHTPEGTTVVVSLRESGGHAVLRVTDSGPGIPPDLLPHVFERFARGDSSRSRAAGSTGLGLAIVYAVVTAHHGTVGVRTEPGSTEFTVTLPLSQTPHRDDTPA